GAAGAQVGPARVARWEHPHLGSPATGDEKTRPAGWRVAFHRAPFSRSDSTDACRASHVYRRDTAGVDPAADELVAAIAAQDWPRLEACFAPDARLFAAVPS